MSTYKEMDMKLTQLPQAASITADAAEEIRTTIRTAAARLLGLPFTDPSLTDVTAYHQACIRIARQVGCDIRPWIAEARRAGVSWLHIGQTVGVSADAAEHRFAHHPLGA